MYSVLDDKYILSFSINESLFPFIHLSSSNSLFLFIYSILASSNFISSNALFSSELD